ncbi:MAG: hypothetical protein ABSH38_17715 [Verrucomicrobiota bacterium]
MTARFFFKAIACAMAFVGTVALAQAQDTKLDPSGKWIWTTPGRNGGPDRTNTLTLKYSGGALTGSIKAPRRGGESSSTDISDGKLAGDKISFKTTRDAGGNTLTDTYEGTLTADSIKGKITSTGGTRERPPRDWEAKREAASK